MGKDGSRIRLMHMHVVSQFEIYKSEYTHPQLYKSAEKKGNAHLCLHWYTHTCKVSLAFKGK